MIEVFHGSVMPIEKPLATVGRPNLDFGKGFYVTNRQSQAEALAVRLGERENRPPTVSVYSFDIDSVKSSFKYKRLAAYDAEWLQFIVNCRSGKGVWKEYDVIEGGVANDRVIDTVEAYVAGLMPLEKALSELCKHQPNNQFCITSQNVIDKCLFFKKSYHVKRLIDVE